MSSGGREQAARAYQVLDPQLGVPVPMWLVRIDYIFHSRDLRATAARIGPWDGVSDHRPIVVTLRVQP